MWCNDKKMSYASPAPTVCMPIQIVVNSLDPVYQNRFLCTLYVISNQLYNGGTAAYTCVDIVPNLWVSNYGIGQAWKIIEAGGYDVNTNSVEVVIEDVDYFNYSLEPYIGLHPPSDYVDGYVFSLSGEGLPILYNIDSSILPQEYVESL